MSLETEIKKVANNLQQLTDAVVTMTAALEAHAPVTVAGSGMTARPIVETVTPDDEIVGLNESADIGGDKLVGIVEKPATVVDIKKNADVVVEGLTMTEANAQLQKIVAIMGDAGAGVRKLLASKNAITLGQIPPENYASFVEEARALISVNQA